VSHKITIQVKEEEMTSNELKLASRYLSDALSKMGIDHVIECQMGKLKLFGIAKNFLGLKPEQSP
jgi:hypothetical protein